MIKKKSMTTTARRTPWHFCIRDYFEKSGNDDKYYMSGLVFQDDHKIIFTNEYLNAYNNFDGTGATYEYILTNTPRIMVPNAPADRDGYRLSYHKNMGDFVANLDNNRTPFDLNENAWFRKKIPVPYWIHFFEDQRLPDGDFEILRDKYNGRFLVQPPVWTIRASWLNSTYYLFLFLMLIFCMTNANIIYSILETGSNLSAHQFYKQYKYTRTLMIVCYYMLWSIAYLIMMVLALYLFETMRNADWLQGIFFPTYSINTSTKEYIIPRMNYYNDGWWMRWILIGVYVGIFGTMIYFAIDFWRQRKSRRGSFHKAFIVLTVAGIVFLGLLFWAAINTTCLYFYNAATGMIEARNPLCRGEERQLPQYWERREGVEGRLNLARMNPYLPGVNYDPAKTNATLYYSDGTFRAAS